MHDVYELFANANAGFLAAGQPLLETYMDKATLTGMISGLLERSLPRHVTQLVRNAYHNGVPDLLPEGKYPPEGVAKADEGVEVKVLGRKGNTPDMHTRRAGFYIIFKYRLECELRSDIQTRIRFTHVWLPRLYAANFRKNPRGEHGTRTASPNARGMEKLRKAWVYRDDS